MAEEPHSLSALLERVAKGEEQAARELYDEYNEAVLWVIRRHLPPSSPLRNEFDSWEFSQEVWQKAFADPEKLRDFDTFIEFVQYLMRTANHTVDHARRKHLDAQKRDKRRERSLSDPEIVLAAAKRAAPDPNPAAQAAFYERWDRWFRSLSQRQQEVVLKLQNGSRYLEIAKQMNCSLRTIMRIVAELRATLPPEMFHS